MADQDNDIKKEEAYGNPAQMGPQAYGNPAPNLNYQEGPQTGGAGFARPGQAGYQGGTPGYQQQQKSHTKKQEGNMNYAGYQGIYDGDYKVDDDKDKYYGYAYNYPPMYMYHPYCHPHQGGFHNDHPGHYYYHAYGPYYGGPSYAVRQPGPYAGGYGGYGAYSGANYGLNQPGPKYGWPNNYQANPYQGGANYAMNQPNPYYGAGYAMQQPNPYYGAGYNMYQGYPYGYQPMGLWPGIFRPGYFSYLLNTPRVNNFFRAIGLLSVGLLLVPSVARAFRPLAVSAVEGALKVSEEVKNIFTDAKEDIDDIFAEAKWENEGASRREKPDKD